MSVPEGRVKEALDRYQRHLDRERGDESDRTAGQRYRNVWSPATTTDRSGDIGLIGLPAAVGCSIDWDNWTFGVPTLSSIWQSRNMDI